MEIKFKKISNQWYPVIKHKIGENIQLNATINKYLTLFDTDNDQEVIIEFEEIGVYYDEPTILVFKNEDLEKILYTNEECDVHFSINGRIICVSSIVFKCIEQNYQFDFHINDYKILI